eukprot:219646-Chlamydomonas_euryale.AAC.1
MTGSNRRGNIGGKRRRVQDGGLPALRRTLARAIRDEQARVQLLGLVWACEQTTNAEIDNMVQAAQQKKSVAGCARKCVRVTPKCDKKCEAADEELRPYIPLAPHLWRLVC